MTALGILALILGLIGILGSVLPGLPGPPLSWVGLLLIYISGRGQMSLGELLVWLAVMGLVTALDYIVPAGLTRASGGHRAASVGATVGLFAGMFFTPVGMIGGSLLGAFLGEFLVENGGAWESFRASLGAFMGFLLGTILKIAASGAAFYRMIALFAQC